jgi:hypothetical protein
MKTNKIPGSRTKLKIKKIKTVIEIPTTKLYFLREEREKQILTTLLKDIFGYY